MPGAYWQPKIRSSLDSHAVHVWFLDIQAEAERAPVLWTHLSRDEQNRAERFIHPSNRTQFGVTHGVLRCLLASYVGCRPDELSFTCNAHGKPFLCLPTGQDLQFNLAHSATAALIAISLNRRIGVDIEQIRPVDLHREIAQRFFTPSETEWILSHAVDESCRAFLHCWVRKEAVVKAIGTGISFGLNQFDVQHGDTIASTPTRLAVPAQDCTWGLRQLQVPSGYLGAVAAEGCDWVVEHFAWNGAELA